MTVTNVKFELTGIKLSCWIYWEIQSLCLIGDANRFFLSKSDY